MLNEQGPGGGGVTHNLQLLLATDSAREDVRRARSAICTSLNGLQRAAKLCCVLGKLVTLSFIIMNLVGFEAYLLTKSGGEKVSGVRAHTCS